MSQGTRLRWRGAVLATAMAFAGLGFAPGLTERTLAVPLSSGQTVTTMLGIGTFPGSYVANETEPFTSQNGLFTGTLESWVYYDPSTSHYDFIYQVANTTPGEADSFDRLSLSNFGGPSNTTDVEYESNGTEIAPVSADRLGGVVGFSFTGNEIAPNQTSDFLFVNTNSTFYNNGSGSIIDGDVGSAQIEAPLAFGIMPEPASIGLLVVGAGMLLPRRRRRS